MVGNSIMKNVALLLAVISCSLSYGQSKKKINTQLKNELRVTNLSYDSIYSAYTDQSKELAGVYKLIVTGMLDLETKREQVQRTSEKNLALHHQLEALGFDPNTLVDLREIKNLDLPKYKFNVAEEKALTTPHHFKVTYDTLMLKGLKIDVQNERIRAQLLVFKNGIALTKEEVKSKSTAIQLLKPVAFTVDSLNRWYDNSLKIRSGNYTVLKNKMDELKENYRVKGPKGFSEAYRQQFPDVHNVADGRPPVVRDYDHETMDGPGDEVFIPAPPAPQKLPKSATDEIYEIVDVPAEYPGGKVAMTDYLSKNLSYPTVAKEKGIQGKCYLKFIVAKSGKISNIKVMRGVPDCPECDAEAIRLVKAMPNWVPGKNNGKEVNSVFNLPVQFKL
jgi:TonB family protein